MSSSIKTIIFVIFICNILSFNAQAQTNTISPAKVQATNKTLVQKIVSAPVNLVVQTSNIVIAASDIFRLPVGLVQIICISPFANNYYNNGKANLRRGFMAPVNTVKEIIRLPGAIIGY